MRILELEGTPAQMGRAFGESCRSEIADLYARRLENAILQARELGGREAGEAELLALARACLAPTREHHPDGYAELCGIAEGAGLAPERLLAMNGLTDLRDALAWPGDPELADACTSCIVQRDASRDRRALYAQTWDLATDNMPFVLGVVRRPAQGPDTWCVTTVGCLSLMGLNEHGIAVGTTNLRTRDARAGVVYLSLLHKALAAESLEDAVRAITGARRAGAHYYAVLDASGQAVALECTASHVARRDVERGSFAHANHCLAPEHVPLEADTPRASSLARQKRLEALLAARAGALDLATLEHFLGDREGGDLALCRDDAAGISSNAAIALCPETRAVRACAGPPCEADWTWLRAPTL